MIFRECRREVFEEEFYETCRVVEKSFTFYVSRLTW